MKKSAVRLLSLVVAVALIGPGVPSPVAAAAESETQPAAPAQAQPAQPDLYQEALKASQPSESQHHGAYQAGAVIASSFSVPGRAFLCGVGSALTLVTLAITFGYGYAAAKDVFEEGCVGKWVVTPDDLRRANQQKGITPDPYLYGR